MPRSSQHMFNTSSSISQKRISYDVNRRMIYSTIEIGCGYKGLAKLSTVLNVPCMTKGAYHTQLESIMVVLEQEAKNEIKRVRAKVRDLRASKKEKKWQQGKKTLQVQREEALREVEGTTYEAGAF